MVGCERTRELLDPYFDNELEFVQAKQIAEHLEVCVECRHEFELLREQDEVVASSIKNQTCDTSKLRAEIEAATVGKPDI